MAGSGKRNRFRGRQAAPANRLATVTNGGVAAYLYDPAGNITGNGTKTFVYNQNQRLIRVLEGSTVKGEYTYDGQGRRDTGRPPGQHPKR